MQKEFRKKELLDWSAGDVCDWLDSLFMPEYKVGQPEIFPGQLISQLLFLGGFSTKQYQWISLGSSEPGGLEQTWS